MGKEPDCDKCFEEPLWNENIEAYEIFNVCKYQLVMGTNGPVDVKFEALKMVMDLYQVSDKRRCLDLVRLAVSAYIDYLKQQASDNG